MGLPENTRGGFAETDHLGKLISVSSNGEGAADSGQGYARDGLELSRRINVASQPEAPQVWTGGPVEDLLVRGGVELSASADPTELATD
jgi:hypothetical protein